MKIQGIDLNSPATVGEYRWSKIIDFILIDFCFQQKCMLGNILLSEESSTRYALLNLPMPSLIDDHFLGLRSDSYLM